MGNLVLFILSFPGDSDGKESTCSAGGPGSIPGLGRSPTPVFLLGESPWTEEPGRYSPWGHKESNLTERLSTAHSENTTEVPPVC